MEDISFILKIITGFLTIITAIVVFLLWYFKKQNSFVKLCKYYKRSIFLIGYSLILTLGLLIYFYGDYNHSNEFLELIYSAANFGLILFLIYFGLPIHDKKFGPNNLELFEYFKQKREFTLFSKLVRNKETKDFDLVKFTKKEIEDLRLRIHKVSKSFNLAWRLSLAGMWIYYLPKVVNIIIIGKVPELDLINSHYFEVLMNTANIVSTIILYTLVLILSQGTYNQLYKENDYPKSKLNVSYVGVSIIIIDICLHLAGGTSYYIYVSVSIALFSSIIMCYFIGRLSSKFININPFWIGILYIYAMTLFVFPLIQYHIEVGPLLFIISFYSKLILGLILIQMFRTGKFIIYMVRANTYVEKFVNDDNKLHQQFRSDFEIPYFNKIFSK